MLVQLKAFLTLSLFPLFLSTRETALTFHVPARREQCFYEDVRKAEQIEIDFQVVDGGDLDIDFAAFDSQMTRVASNKREQYGAHTFDVAVSGVYKLCFSNKFSKVTAKTVFMDVYVDDGNYEPDEDAVADAQLESSMKLLNRQVDNIKNFLFKAQVSLQLAKAQRNKDQKIQISNSERVDRWSMVNCIFMMLMAAIQVHLLKKMFKEDKRAKRQAKI